MTLEDTPGTDTTSILIPSIVHRAQHQLQLLLIPGLPLNRRVVLYRTTISIDDHPPPQVTTAPRCTTLRLNVREMPL